MINYRLFIEENFMIDLAKTSQLVPFKLNEVQNHYYDDLQSTYNIEKYGINIAIREDILKARREGFSSFVLGLFAADDLTQDNPTETDVLSYKDDATSTFRSRYRTYLLTFFLKEQGYTYEQIQKNINLLEEIAPHVLSVDSTDIEIKHNKAHFQCNTASARTGGRGGVRHKILFSENAFYPDTPKLSAAEMIEATSQQVDPDTGWIFMETTENGIGTYQHKLWQLSKKGRNRFKNRFYGSGMFYSEERIATIKSGYVDMDAFRRDYPKDEDDLFKGGTKAFTTESDLEKLIEDKDAGKEIVYKIDLRGDNYIDQADTIKAELELLERSYPGYSLYAGLDTAKNIDATSLTVIKERQRSVSGGLKILCIDVTNGEFMSDWFEKNTSWYIEKIKFSRPSKSLMYTNLQIVIADKLTSIPRPKHLVDGSDEWVSDEEARFWSQMMSLEKETKGSLLVVAHPEGSCNRADHDYDECPYHDDYPDSWMLAEQGFVIINGVPKRAHKPEAHTIPNVVQKLLDKGSLRDKYRTGGNSETSYE